MTFIFHAGWCLPCRWGASFVAWWLTREGDPCDRNKNWFRVQKYRPWWRTESNEFVFKWFWWWHALQNKKQRGMIRYLVIVFPIFKPSPSFWNDCVLSKLNMFSHRFLIVKIKWILQHAPALFLEALVCNWSPLHPSNFYVGLPCNWSSKSSIFQFRKITESSLVHVLWFVRNEQINLEGHNTS